MTNETKPVLCIFGESDMKIWHSTPRSRLERAFSRIGITEVVAPENLKGRTSQAVLVRADVVLDTPLISALVKESGAVLLPSEASDARPLAVHAPPGLAEDAIKFLQDPDTQDEPGGFRKVRPNELGGSYWHALRKREEPYAIRLTTDNLAQTEWRMFMGTYKGATDLVTKWLWPRPAFYATRFCARFGITPNQVTWLSFLFVLLAFWLFLEGQYLLGLLAGWAMTFLDTVDGKLARITLTSSKFGNAFDHGIDLVHPPFWYVAWALGLKGSALALDDQTFYWCLSVILAGYVLQRVLEGLSIWLFNLEIHVWRKIDTYFRQITARRNPNMLLLTFFTVFGRPDWGLLAVALWTAVCFVLHIVQFGQAWSAKSKQGKLSSWLTEAAN